LNFVAAFEARWRVQHPLPPYRSGDAERLSRARFLRSGGRTRLGCRVERLAQRSALKGLRRDAEGSLRDAGAPRTNGTSTPGMHSPDRRNLRAGNTSPANETAGQERLLRSLTTESPKGKIEAPTSAADQTL